MAIAVSSAVFGFLVSNFEWATQLTSARPWGSYARQVQLLTTWPNVGYWLKGQLKLGQKYYLLAPRSTGK
jgi:hypothetical protein